MDIQNLNQKTKNETSQNENVTKTPFIGGSRFHEVRGLYNFKAQVTFESIRYFLFATL